jgi:hypothetical protein
VRAGCLDLVLDVEAARQIERIRKRAAPPKVFNRTDIVARLSTAESLDEIDKYEAMLTKIDRGIQVVKS